MHYAFERASFLLIPLLVTVFQIAFSYIFFFIFNIFSFSLICIMDHDGNGFGMDELWRIFFYACSHGLMSLVIGRAMGFAEMTRLNFSSMR